MSLDYRKGTYRPSRPNTRNNTSYGSMSKWISRQHEAVPAKGAIPKTLMEIANPSPKFTKKRPLMKESPLGMPKMYDVYYNNSSAVLDESEPYQPELDEHVPVHLRYSKHCGYDDYHKAFRTIEDRNPGLSYPHFGPPRLRHGRQGGSWRHVKEVLQAGGNRIVFVDGQIRSDDLIKMDSVPGGHLILPKVDRGTPSPRLVQQMNRLNDDLIQLSMGNGYQNIPVAKYSQLDAKTGMEKGNWHIMR